MFPVYADEDFSRPVVEWLKESGWDIITARDDGRANQRIADDRVLDRAMELGRALLTSNRSDFRQLHRQRSGNHNGIVVVRPSARKPRLTAELIDRALRPINDAIGKFIVVHGVPNG